MSNTEEIKNASAKPCALKGVLVLLICFITACSSAPLIKPEFQVDAPPDDELTKAALHRQQQANKQKYQQAVAALEQNILDKAEQLFAEFNQANPALAGATTNLAIINYRKGNYEEALALVNRSIKINPELAEAYHVRGLLQLEMREISLAEKDYLKALQLKPDYINAHYNLALLYDIYFQDIALAIKHYEIYQSLINIPDETTSEWIIHLRGTLENG